MNESSRSQNLDFEIMPASTSHRSRREYFSDIFSDISGPRFPNGKILSPIVKVPKPIVQIPTINGHCGTIFVARRPGLTSKKAHLSSGSAARVRGPAGAPGGNGAVVKDCGGAVGVARGSRSSIGVKRDHCMPLYEGGQH